MAFEHQAHCFYSHFCRQGSAKYTLELYLPNKLRAGLCMNITSATVAADVISRLCCYCCGHCKYLAVANFIAHLLHDVCAILGDAAECANKSWCQENMT